MPPMWHLLVKIFVWTVFKFNKEAVKEVGYSMGRLCFRGSIIGADY